ncbi:uncharacterized protein TNCV_2076361 [Trichonephila clavipes]|nr:uncharacterized protein TNCV_2076361 [Trichonephila clavipes]
MFLMENTIENDRRNPLHLRRVKLVVGFGEGAGANALVRFTIMNWKLLNIGMNPSTEQYLVLHKFGAQLETVENKDKLIQEFTEKLKRRINPRNLRRYVESYMK